MFELKNRSIVVVANSFNPSIFNSHWFVKNDILKEEDILPKSICSQDIAQITTNNFNMIVILNQLILNVLSENDNDTLTALSNCIKKLPHIPYTAIGINFNYFVPISNDKSINLTRELFFNPTNSIHSLFDTPDARFGAYFSLDYKGSRLKLDIKPNHILENNKPDIIEMISFNFNYHKDFNKDNAFEELISYLTKYDEFKNYSNIIMKNVIK